MESSPHGAPEHERPLTLDEAKSVLTVLAEAISEIDDKSVLADMNSLQKHEVWQETDALIDRAKTEVTSLQKEVNGLADSPADLRQRIRSATELVTSANKSVIEVLRSEPNMLEPGDKPTIDPAKLDFLLKFNGEAS